ncbi:MAG TPA: carboxypeptidase-like regulatory domain-containing protein [Gemmatimonadaceae bacterium]|nr:carboxypeptidase-like regulatory domain-containing protein [Gemmatimonadaceae bacterium]
MRTVIATTALAFLIAHSPITAQQTRLGRLEGTVAPWIASRAVHAAQISLINLESEASTTFTAAVDANGRFRLDPLPEGRYLVQVSHPTLDSLDITLPPGQLVIAAGRTTRADFSLPSGERLRTIVCPGVRLGAEKAVVAGRVVEAETEAPLVGAKVVAAWTELSVDRKRRAVVTQGKQAVVSTGRGGEYRLCGVPVVKSLELQLQHADRAGAAIRVTVLPEEGVAVRDFSLSTRFAPTITALDALDSLDRLALAGSPDSRVQADSTRASLALSGGATLTGTVRATSGQPVVGAEVRVRHGEASAVTDDAGRFVLGGLPSGTQVLFVRRLGYELAEQPVALRPGRSVDVSVRLARVVALDSVRVTASRARLAEFEHNRKTNLLGRFLTLSDIQRSQAKKTSDLLPLLGGYVMMGRGRRVRMSETDYDPPGTHSCKDANVVIDGVDGQAVDDVLPNQIAGIEAYKNAAAAPLEYAGRADCGLIVIWLRPGPRWQGWRALFSGAPKLE